MVRTPSAPAIIAGLIVLVATGCQDETVRHYKVSRVPEPPTRLLGAILPAGDQVWFVKLSGPEAAVAPHRGEFEQMVRSIRFAKEGDEPITWSTPTGWRTESGTRSQRYATLHVGADNLEVTVSALDWKGNEVLPNVNRWRKQVGLGEITAAELSQSAQIVEIGGTTATLVDITGPPDAERKQLLASAAAEKKSNITPRAPDPEPPAPVQKPVTYQAPAGWVDLPVPPNSIRVAALGVNDGDRTAQVTVIPLSGPAGGLAANVNRWRGEIGLANAADDQIAREAKTIDVAGIRSTYVDLTGPRERTLGVIVPRGEQTWFIKFRGPAELVGKQQSAFEAFVRSLRFGTGG
jgi:peptidoglycan/xylan/chitin deacetylase (PgdA/CDA1 family)